METLEDFLELSQAVSPATVTSTVHLAITAQTFCWAFFVCLLKHIHCVLEDPIIHQFVQSPSDLAINSN